MSYLDDTGLAYFWTKIKAYVSSFLTWTNIQNKPSTFAPSAHSHGNITNAGELGTASRVVVTDGNKKVSVSSVTSTELGYLSDVTSNVQTQLNGKANASAIPTIPNLSRTITGSGNAITDITVSGHAITATKGSTFLTSVSGTAGTSLLAWDTENTVYTVGGHAIKVKLPANPNTDTHWTSHLYAGASNGNTNAATTNGNTYLIICDNTTARDRRLIKGTGATTVTSDSSGNITINSTDNNTTYSANNGVGLSGTTFYNSGVRSIATGSTNGTISVNTNGTAANVAVKGLGTAAYTASTAYAAASHSHSNYVDKSTDQTIGGVKTFSESPLSKKNYWVLTDVAYTNKTAAAKYGSYYFGDKDVTAQGRLMFYRNANGAGVGAEIQVCQYNSTSNSTIINGYLSTATGDTNRYVCIGSDYQVFRSNDANDGVKLGNGTYRWAQLYATTTTIATSDERKKTEIVSVPDNILDIWEGVNFCQFKMKKSVAEKGSENARIHNGAIAQSIDRLYKQHNIDISKYGLFCYDSWEKVEPTYDDVGGILNDGVEAGDAYSLRYEEVLCMEAAYQRRENARLKKRVADLEERLAALELKAS